MTNIVGITIALAIIVASFIYIKDQLDIEQMWDVLVAVLIFGGALIWLYVKAIE